MLKLKHPLCAKRQIDLEIDEIAHPSKPNFACLFALGITLFLQHFALAQSLSVQVGLKSRQADGGWQRRAQDILSAGFPPER